jgi:hypothetical protein
MDKLEWTRPSRMELEDGPPSTPVPLFDSADDAQLASEVPAPAVAGSSQRGIILHKLMEEVLTAETSATGAALYRRAGELIAQLGLEPNSDPASGISPGELAAAMERTLNLAEIAQLRERLVPEHTIFARESSPAGEILVSGIADAVALDAEAGSRLSSIGRAMSLRTSRLSRTISSKSMNTAGTPAPSALCSS